MSPEKNANRYFKQFDNKLARFLDRLAKYLENPNVDNIHQVRTSFRRLEATYSLFPSAIKTCDSEKFLEHAKHFFRLNSVIRDSDIVLEKLKKQPRSAPIVQRLHQIRAENLEQAMVVARELTRLPEPRLHEKKARLDKHLQHKVDHRIDTIRRFVPLIKDDEENTEELHAMRKQAKKLFYLLELEIEPAGCREMKNLKNLQTMAGDIHDCDVTIAFLDDNRSLLGHAEELIEAEHHRRHECYEQLLSQLDESFWNRLGRLI